MLRDAARAALRPVRTALMHGTGPRERPGNQCATLCGGRGAGAPGGGLAPRARGWRPGRGAQLGGVPSSARPPRGATNHVKCAALWGASMPVGARAGGADMRLLCIKSPRVDVALSCLLVSRRLVLVHGQGLGQETQVATSATREAQRSRPQLSVTFRLLACASLVRVEAWCHKFKLGQCHEGAVVCPPPLFTR